MTKYRNRILRNSYYNMVAMVSNTVVRLIASIIVARELGPLNMGLYSFVTFLVGIVDIATNMGLGHVAIKYISEFTGTGDAENRDNVFSYVLTRKLLLGICASIILILSSGYIGEYYGEKALQKYIILASILLLPTGISVIFHAAIQGLQEFRATAIRALLVGPIYLASFFAVIKLGYGINGLLVASTIVVLFEVYIYYIYLRKYLRFRLNIKNIFTNDIKMKIGTFNWTVAIIVILDSVVWQKSEVLFLGKLSSKESIAYYSIAYNLASYTVTFLPQVFTNVLYPVISEMYGKDDQQRIKNIFLQSTRYLMMFAIPISLLGIALSDEIVLLLYGAPYTDVGPVVKILFISSCLGIIASPGSSVLYATERTPFMLKMGIGITILNIGLNLLLIPGHGAIGAAIANSSSQCLSVIIGTIFICKNMMIRFPFMDGAKILLASLGMSVIVCVVLQYFGGIAGISLSIFSGMVLYLFMLSRSRIFKESDQGILFAIRDRLPSIAQGPFEKIVLFEK